MKSRNLSLEEHVEIFQKSVFLTLKSWKKIVVVALFGILLGFFYSYSQKQYYKAELTFSIQENGEPKLKPENFFLFPSINTLFKSKFIIKKTLLTKVYIDSNNVTLVEYYLKNSNLKFDNSLSRLLNEVNFDISYDSLNYKQNLVLDYVYSDLISSHNLQLNQISPKSSILKLTINSENENFSYHFCNNLFLTFSHFYTNSKSKKLLDDIVFQQKVIDSVKNISNNQLLESTTINNKIFLLNPSKSKLNSNNNIEEAEINQRQNFYIALLSQIEKDKVVLNQLTPIYNIIDSPSFPLLQIKASKFKLSILSGFYFGLTYFFINLIVMNNRINKIIK